MRNWQAQPRGGARIGKRANFDACPMHSPFGFVHLTHQNLSARALFCLNSLAKVNTQLLIYNYFINVFAKNYVVVKLFFYYFLFFIFFSSSKEVTLTNSTGQKL